MDHEENDDNDHRHFFDRLCHLQELQVLNISSTYARLDTGVSFFSFGQEAGLRLRYSRALESPECQAHSAGAAPRRLGVATCDVPHLEECGGLPYCRWRGDGLAGCCLTTGDLVDQA